jgi:hypothetical protein
VLRVLPAILLALPAFGQSVQEAAERLGRKAAMTLRAVPPVAISLENRSSLSAPAERVRAILEREVNKGEAAPAGAPVVTAYIAESASGLLLIATSDCGDAPCVAMERFVPEADEPRGTLTARPVITHTAAILDFAINGDSLAVLESDRVALYKRESDGWRPAGALPFTPAAPMPRDPRGRLILHEGGYDIRLPGSRCVGTAAIICKSDESPWTDGNVQLAFKTRRNVLLMPPGLRGEDFAQITSGCGAATLSISGNLLEATGVKPMLLSGAPFALWSSERAGEASLVLWNSSTNEFEASRVAISCDH